VFVNPDPEAMPLAEYLEAVPDDLAWLGLDDFRGNAVVTVPVTANWKVVADGFSETVSRAGLHREMIGSMDDIDAPQQVWGHTSKSAQHYGVPSPRFRGGLDDQTVWDSFIITQGGRMGITEPCPVLRARGGRVRCRRDRDADSRVSIGEGWCRPLRLRHHTAAGAAPVQPVPERDGAHHARLAVGDRRPAR
jgi:hypothetical protein